MAEAFHARLPSRASVPVFAHDGATNGAIDRPLKDASVRLSAVQSDGLLAPFV
jgi:hypothetical protein